MKRCALGLLLLVSLLVGCGASDVDVSTSEGRAEVPVDDPDRPITMSPIPGSDVHDVGGRPERVRPQPGMADVRAVPWDTARQTPSGRSLRITYWSGVEPCNVLDRVDVEYGSAKITVTLYQGHDPAAEDVACIEIAVRKVVRVPLEEPVEGRPIVDGAKP